jgi:hypothetical protein
MGSGSSTPSLPAPDPAIGQAASQSAQTGQNWLNFSQGAYGTEQGMQSGINNVTNQVTQQQLSAENQDQSNANAETNYYNANVQPVETNLLQTAQNYASPANQEEAASTAKADVAENAAQQEGTQNRQMAAEGVNPASGRWAGINRATGLGTAVSEAGAENTARTNTINTGAGLESNAIGLGNANLSAAATDAGLATGAGTTAANTTNAANTQYIAGTGIMNTGEAGAEQGEANEGNLLQNEYNSTLQGSEFSDQLQEQEQSSLMGGIGSLAGTLGAAAILSSKTYKTNKRASTGNLDAVRSMPVEKWNYKGGIGDGGAAPHVGPYAEDFHKATGLGDGKTIPMQDAIGVSMGAINELADKLNQVHKAVGLGATAPKLTAPKGGGEGGKVKMASVAGTKPPKLAMKKPAQVKAQAMKLPQYRPLKSINLNKKAA